MRTYDPREDESYGDPTGPLQTPGRETPNEYEARARELYERSEGRLGLKIPVLKGRPFYSKGWRGCEFCWGDVKGPTTLYYFEEQKDGIIRKGWRCHR